MEKNTKSTIRLRTHSDWVRKLSQRTLIGYENYQKIRSTRTGIEKSYGRTYTGDSVSGYASEEAGSHKNTYKQPF